MSKHKLHQRIIFSMFVAAMLTSLNPQKVYACTSSPEMPWFIPSLSLIASDIPAGAAELKPAGNALLLQNDSDSLMRVVISNSYPDKNGYYELSKGQSALLHVNSWNKLDPDELFIDTYLITSLDPRNVVGGNRPTDVKVPNPQSATVHLIMNGQSYFVQLQTSYALNPDYQPVTILALDSSCESPLSSFLAQFNLPITGFVCISSLLLVVGIIVFVKLRKRKPKDNSIFEKS
jgi:hypothetical protein